jgi:hypothetical protein
MQRPFELRFSAVGALEVTIAAPMELLKFWPFHHHHPVQPSGHALNAIEDAANLPDPLTCAAGDARASNQHLHLPVCPDKGFATTYTARVGKGLKDALGWPS